MCLDYGIKFIILLRLSCDGHTLVSIRKIDHMYGKIMFLLLCATINNNFLLIFTESLHFLTIFLIYMSFVFYFFL